MDQHGTRKQENLKQPVVTKQQALRMLETYFGYTSFRPAQEAPIASLLRNEDELVSCQQEQVSPSASKSRTMQGRPHYRVFPTNLSYERSSGWSISTEYSGGAHQ